MPMSAALVEILVQKLYPLICYWAVSGHVTVQSNLQSSWQTCSFHQTRTLGGDQIEVVKIVNRYEHIGKHSLSHLRKIVKLEDMK